MDNNSTKQPPRLRADAVWDPHMRGRTLLMKVRDSTCWHSTDGNIRVFEIPSTGGPSVFVPSFRNEIAGPSKWIDVLSVSSFDAAVVEAHNLFEKRWM